LYQEFIKHPLIKENIIEKRDYQVKIASNCIKRNTLVCLPTALGKTIIAALVTAEKLILNPDKKVVMLAPTRPLVLQHFERFKKIFNLRLDDLAAITGEISPNQRIDLWKRKLIFSTPQVFMNDLILGQVDAKSISLLIFDEAHRATGDYAYTFIAERYSQENEGLILGLTASPGSSKEDIEKICKNLFIKHIEARTTLSPDVKPYIKRVSVEWIKVDLPRIFFQIKKCFIKFIEEQSKTLKQYGINFDKLSLKNVLKTKEILRKDFSLSEKQNVLRHLCLTLDSIIHSIKSIELLETQGLIALSLYLKGLVERIKAKPINPARIFIENPSIIEAKSLIEKAIAEGLDHPKVTKLKEIVKNSFKGKVKRIIVFTNYRKTAMRLAQALNELNNEISASRLVGQLSKGEDKGLSQKEQIEVLEDFKSGKYNVLVATQIGEEGLDIIDCDEVIFYDSVSSAIRFIQRKGRTGRKWPGKVIVLLASKTRDEAYYWIAKRKEKIMDQTLRDIVNMENKQKGQARIEDFIKKIDDKSPNQKIKIIIDSRESSSPIIKELSKFDLSIELKSLEIGDYVLSDRIVIEKKTTEDFIASIVDGRLFNQLIKLKNTYESPLVIIEGESLYTSRAIRLESIMGAIASVIIDYKIPIIWTRNPIETASLLFHIAKREQLKEKHEPRIRYESKPKSLDEIKEYIVAGLPHINTTLAKRLLKRFKTVEKIFTASEKELQEVDGIGKKISEEIKKVLTEEYKESE
jgi:Fanconi anemia group M protein